MQIEYSLLSRGPERSLLPTCRELGVAITAYGVLGRGLLSGSWSKERELPPGDVRSFGPRFSGDNLDRNLALVEALRTVAQAQGRSVAEIAIAWVLARGVDVVALIGARRPERLNEALGALGFTLGAEAMAEIEAAIPPDAAAGSRYPEALMAHLDSERG